MSLDNFQIPATLAAELYKDSLVVLDGKQPIKETLKERKLFALGGNKKNILIIVDDLNSSNLSDADLDFLTSVLNACKLSLADIAVINLANNVNAEYDDLITEMRSKKIIIFGIESHQLTLPVELTQFLIVKYKQQTLLSAPALSEIANDKELKKQLWVCLKTIFDL